MSSKLSFTDINSWYTSLNTLKNKENINLGSETAPNLNERQVRATDINDYINKLNALRTNEYFRHADWISISTVSSSEQIRDILKENINTEITNLDKVCANYSVTTSNSTCSTQDCNTCQTDKTNSCKTNMTRFCTTFNQSSSCNTNSTCATNSTYSGGRKVFNTHNDSFSNTYSCFTVTQSTNSTNSTCSTNFTSTNSTCSTDFTTSYRYNFSVVSGKAVVSNSKTSPQ